MEHFYVFDVNYLRFWWEQVIIAWAKSKAAPYYSNNSQCLQDFATDHSRLKRYQSSRLKNSLIAKLLSDVFEYNDWFIEYYQYY